MSLEVARVPYFLDQFAEFQTQLLFRIHCLSLNFTYNMIHIFFKQKVVSEKSDPRERLEHTVHRVCFLKIIESHTSCNEFRPIEPSRPKYLSIEFLDLLWGVSWL